MLTAVGDTIVAAIVTGLGSDVFLRLLRVPHIEARHFQLGVDLADPLEMVVSRLVVPLVGVDVIDSFRRSFMQKLRRLIWAFLLVNFVHGLQQHDFESADLQVKTGCLCFVNFISEALLPPKL